MRCSEKTLSASVPCSVWNFSRVLPTGGWLTLCVFPPGCFVAIYRILLNSFPLLFPADVPLSLNLRNLTKRLFPSSDFDNSAVDESSPLEYDSPIDITPAKKKGAVRLSFVAQAHQTWLRRRSARWHSVVAGAVAGGIAITLENPSRRKVIAQQLFVRQVPFMSFVFFELKTKRL